MSKKDTFMKLIGFLVDSNIDFKMGSDSENIILTLLQESHARNEYSLNFFFTLDYQFFALHDWWEEDKARKNVETDDEDFFTINRPAVKEKYFDKLDKSE